MNKVTPISRWIRSGFERPAERKRWGLIRFPWVLPVILFLGSGSIWAATTYYVATDGNNANNGSSGQPWKTLQKAADTVVAGDTVIVRAGAYAGFVLGWNGPQNGTAQNPITFKGESGATINARNIQTADGINLEGTSHIVIEGFEITNPGGTITRAGIRSVTNHHITIRQCSIDGMGRWGIFTGFTDDVLLENNRCSHSKDEHGIYVSNSCVRPVVRNNTLFGNKANGLHMNGDSSQGGAGIITDGLVEKNVIYDNGSGGGSGINGDGIQRTIIRNNLLYNNHASGISLYRIDAAQPAKDNLVVNNTIIMASDGRWCINIKDGSTGNIIFNNILYHHGNKGSITTSTDSRSGLVSDYNIVKDLFSPDDSNWISLAAWRTQTGQDTHSTIATPTDLFVNVSGGDYHLKAGTVAENSGISALSGKSAPTDDLDSNSRPSGSGYDAGAYERQVDAPTYTLSVIKGTGDGTYAAGTNVSITADAAPPGQVFDQWTGSNAIADLTAASTTIQMPAAATTITATYKTSPPTKFRLELGKAGTGNGSVEASPSSESYDPGTVVTLTAKADVGSGFANWEGSLLGNSNPTQLTMDSDKTVTARFNSVSAGNQAPQITSGAKANPNPAVIGSGIEFSISAFDPEGDPLTILWNFGDGSSGTGAQITHTYSAVGIFDVSVAVTDLAGQTVTAHIGVTVVGSPGDGQTLPMTITKIIGRVKFGREGLDRCRVTGILYDLPQGFKPAGETFVLNVGGAIVQLELNSKGQGSSDHGRIRLRLKPAKKDPATKEKVFQGGDVTFTGELYNSSWSSAWGFDAAISQSGDSFTMGIGVELGGQQYFSETDVLTSSKADVGGKFKK